MRKPDQQSIRAVYMRGGTSRALIFHRKDLPALDNASDMSPWNRLFLAALGSPDELGRQLDGFGGGISSLSKVAIVGPSSRPDADVDYTFAQVGIVDRQVSYKGNCGNISSAIGPFAIDEGLLASEGERARVRIHNTNTSKIVIAEFGVAGGQAAVKGEYKIQGVSGTGAPIRLNFQEPGGSVTGKLFPTGKLKEWMLLDNGRKLQVSLVDAANPVAFVCAEDIGVSGDETPDEISRDNSLMKSLRMLRIAASLRMGVANSEDEACTVSANLPLIAIMGRPREINSHIRVLMISAGLPHKATPLTGAMCLAVAAKIGGTLVAELIGGRSEQDADLCIEHPSGKLAVAAQVCGKGLDTLAQSATVYRTARRLMEGEILIPTEQPFVVQE